MRLSISARNGTRKWTWVTRISDHFKRDKIAPWYEVRVDRVAPRLGFSRGLVLFKFSACNLLERISMDSICFKLFQYMLRCLARAMPEPS